MLDRFETAEVIIDPFRLTLGEYGDHDGWRVGSGNTAEDRIAEDL